ncbi:serine hydrolase [Paraglaciecola arctica]|uniref:serine hydrolase n=1 Tax=Paraglaciecola arctica TaxID=1128911 RepID=UPI001C07854F|nr:serine hydrolase [Paraglaciecola arctica]MBU3005431.1 serine hydrolase [Paraglaciecola arctica]
MKFFTLIFILLALVPSAAAKWDPQSLDATVKNAIDTFYTPGMSVSVVHQNQLIYAKGFGLANIAKQLPVNKNTYFRLASTSKAFTAAAIGVLVDQEKLDWKDLVIDHLPHFRMQDDYATQHFTIEDLLTHKSGLVGGAGDSMIWPEPSGFSRAEVVKNLRYLTPRDQFRQRYAYSNVLYITAGEIVEKISGKSFEDFVDQHVFKPLGMQCYAGDMPKTAVNKSAMSYGHRDSEGIYPIPRNAIQGDALMSAAAGGMVCSAAEMSKWVSALLNDAKMADELSDLSETSEQPQSSQQLPFSNKQLNKMWQSYTILGVSDTDTEWDSTYFRNYGLGWRLSNYEGYKHISHTGTLSGYQAFVALIPELELGVVVLNNGSNYGARSAVMQTVLKMFIDTEQKDWVAEYVAYQDEREQAYLSRGDTTPKALAKGTLSNKQVVGTYSDQWFGDFIITEQTTNKKANRLRITSSRMANLRGTLSAFQDASYKIEWDNKNAASDAFMHFELDVERKVIAAKLHPFSTKTSSSHEWRDMHFLKAE